MPTESDPSFKTLGPLLAKKYPVLAISAEPLEEP
jgi:hypothetical protein